MESFANLYNLLEQAKIDLGISIPIDATYVMYNTVIIGDYDISSCKLEYHVDHLYLGNLITTQAYRNKGHATKIIQTCQSIATLHKLPLRLFCRNWTDNGRLMDLVQFYKSRGFVVVSSNIHVTEFVFNIGESNG